MCAYSLHLTGVDDDVVNVASDDKASLAVIRDEAKLHGYEVGEITEDGGNFRFRARSDEPGKVREFLMGLDDVNVEE